ncbi:MAG: acyl-CoA dehydrogenase [Polyangiaceae bacterium]|nr:acyl-CoA dehydrogenase [Polyangiaceae bacterium]
MAPTVIDARNLEFLLYEQFGVESLTEHAPFTDHSRETFDLALATAHKLGREVLWPPFREMDQEPPVLIDGRVRVHPSIRALLRECGQGGWINADVPVAHGGLQIPRTVMTAFRAILAAANYSTSVFPALTAGAAHLLASFGAEELGALYLPKMYAGEWQGTMALTEPQAGSSLSDIRTRATPTTEGHYLIHGQKIFISAARHDQAENGVNLLLARIDGAPAGVKGISLFVVPDRRPTDSGLVDNDVTCTSVYHKVGYRGAPITQLSLGDAGDCRGWLVGQPHSGLRYMFQMMNEARIEVGLGATAIASAAYHAALDYARHRPQGRPITSKDPAQAQVPIIEHADVKRMLLFQRAVVEGSLSLVLQCTHYSDLAQTLQGDARERCELLLDLLTPAAKSYPAEQAILAVSQGLQCLGGYGYCADFALEQYYRDVRIHTIHEGTTGIQALDLLGRKVVRDGGKAMFLFLDEVGTSISEARGVAGLGAHAAQLQAALDRLTAVTQHLTGLALEGKIDLFLADATLYLEVFGTVAVAWQWLRQAMTAERGLERDPSEADARFYRSKLSAFRFFFAYELPKVEGPAARLLDSDGLTLKTEEELFA